MTRILHFSDVHLPADFTGVPMRSFLNKRFVGWANLLLRRGKHYANGAEKLASLAASLKELQIDAVLNTGDYTSLGTEPELLRAKEVVAPFAAAPQGFFTMPGNHDVYLADSVGRFESHFGEFMETHRTDLATDSGWPRVRFVGDDVAMIAIDSTRPNAEVFRSSGRIPDKQIAALRVALRDGEVKRRFVIIATHYAPRLWNGQPDSISHGLENADALLAACRDVHRGVLVHGHVHRAFHLPASKERPVAICGAGSATHRGREGVWVYETDGLHAHATPGRWDEDASKYVFDGTPVRIG